MTRTNTAQGGAAPTPVVTDKTPFPPKRKEPPAHYLRQPQPWDGYTSERMELGGDRFTRFDNKIIGGY